MTNNPITVSGIVVKLTRIAHPEDLGTPTSVLEEAIYAELHALLDHIEKKLVSGKWDAEEKLLQGFPIMYIEGKNAAKDEDIAIIRSIKGEV